VPAPVECDRKRSQNTESIVACESFVRLTQRRVRAATKRTAGAVADLTGDEDFQPLGEIRPARDERDRPLVLPATRSRRSCSASATSPTWRSRNAPERTPESSAIVVSGASRGFGHRSVIDLVHPPDSSEGSGVGSSAFGVPVGTHRSAARSSGLPPRQPLSVCTRSVPGSLVVPVSYAVLGVLVSV